VQLLRAGPHLFAVWSDEACIRLYEVENPAVLRQISTLGSLLRLGVFGFSESPNSRLFF